MMAEMDVDDYYEGTQSNAPNTQASDQCIKKVIRLAIFTEQKRTPLSRQDITKKCNIPPKHFNAIMEKVNQKLKSDFAMEMCQLSVRAPRKQVLNMEVINAEDKKSNQWILRSLIDDCDRRDWLLDTEETATLNFLTIVLGFIYINGKEMPQETLKSRLTELGFDYNTTYEDLGLLPDLLQKLVKSLYLDMFKPDLAEDRYVFVWGKRSKVLFSYESVTEFIVDMHGLSNESERQELAQGIMRAADGM